MLSTVLPALCSVFNLNNKNVNALIARKLVIVDTKAAPVLYIVGQQYSCSLCSSLKYTDS